MGLRSGLRHLESDPARADTLAVNADGSLNVTATFASSSEVKITDGTDTALVDEDGNLNVVIDSRNFLQVAVREGDPPPQGEVNRFRFFSQLVSSAGDVPNGKSSRKCLVK